MSTPSLAANRVAIIDADSIVYAAASVSERLVKDGDTDMWLETQTLEECYHQVVSSTEHIMDLVGASRAYLCLTGRANFRKDLLPTYKANRKETRQPTFRAPVMGLLQERRPFPTLCVEGLEADDLCGITSGTLQAQGQTPIICSEDKDLKTIPGWLWQKGQLQHVFREEADYYHAYQTLMGDSTDNYAGCRCVGPKKAAAILEPYVTGNLVDVLAGPLMWERVFAEFTLRGHSEEYALTQARVARILRVTDWDPSKREVILWTPPTTCTTLK